MTDERIGARLWLAIDRLPEGDGGIVFRHYSLGETDRLQLGRQVAAAARERQLSLAVAGSAGLAEELGADLLHNPDGNSNLPVSLAVHDQAEAGAALLRGAALAFISPVYPTTSHPDRPALGEHRAAELAKLVACPAIALGGMDEERFAALSHTFPGRFYGYAAIDFWLGERLRT
jgi:thiamine-phosphate pyrophosphorylase